MKSAGTLGASNCWTIAPHITLRMLILKERLDGEPLGRRVFTNRFRRTAAGYTAWVCASFFLQPHQHRRDQKIQRDQDSNSQESTRRSAISQQRLAPRTASYDARIARHDLESGHLRQATKLRLPNQEFPVDIKFPELPHRSPMRLEHFLAALPPFSIRQNQV